MATEVVMPQMGESIFEGTITKWLKKAGDTVQKDEPLFEISTDKVDAEIPSPVAGVLSEIKVAEGATVGINTVVAVVEEQGTGNREQGTEVRDQGSDVKPEAGTAGTDVVMPQMGESIFEGTITKWLKKAGEAVQKDEPLFEISTDKVDAEIPSPVAGVLTEIKVGEGATVEINTVVAVIGGQGSGFRVPFKSLMRALPGGAWRCHSRRILRRLHALRGNGCALRRWSSGSRKRTSSISTRFREQGQKAASPRKTC